VKPPVQSDGDVRLLVCSSFCSFVCRQRVFVSYWLTGVAAQ